MKGQTQREFILHIWLVKNEEEEFARGRLRSKFEFRQGFIHSRLIHRLLIDRLQLFSVPAPVLSIKYKQPHSLFFIKYATVELSMNSRPLMIDSFNNRNPQRAFNGQKNQTNKILITTSTIQWLEAKLFYKRRHHERNNVFFYSFS